MGKLINGVFKKQEQRPVDHSENERLLNEIKYQAGMEMLKLSVIIHDIGGDISKLILPPGVIVTQEMLEHWWHPDLTYEQVYHRTAGFKERMPATNWELELFYAGFLEI